VSWSDGDWVKWLGWLAVLALAAHIFVSMRNG
jgi:hypothetical protein